MWPRIRKNREVLHSRHGYLGQEYVPGAVPRDVEYLPASPVRTLAYGWRISAPLPESLVQGHHVGDYRTCHYFRALLSRADAQALEREVEDRTSLCAGFHSNCGEARGASEAPRHPLFRLRTAPSTQLPLAG